MKSIVRCAAGRGLTPEKNTDSSGRRRSHHISLCIFDPKAEITCVCAHFLKACGRDVYVLNPFGILLNRMKGLKQATWNPLSMLDPKSPNFHSDCDKIAEAICYEEGKGEDSHWILSARILISGIIAALVKYGTPAENNLLAVRSVITGANGPSVYDFCRECMKLPDVFIRQKLGRYAAAGVEEKQGNQQHGFDCGYAKRFHRQRGDGRKPEG